MTDIIDVDSFDNGKVVVMGDERASTRISFQLAQDFYNEITGKSEKLKDFSNDPFILKLSDLEQLHHRLFQCTEQYNICSFHETYSVSYVDDSSERFSSLERLKIHVGGKGCAVEEVIVKVNILIILPKTHRPQEYVVTVRLASRVAKIEEMRNQMGSMPFDIPLYQFENVNAAAFTIEYVDSTVAAALMTVIKSWFNTVDCNEISPSLKTVRKLSHFVPKISKYGLFSVSYYCIWSFSGKYLTPHVDMRTTALFICTALMLAYISTRIGGFIGRKAERALDSIYEQSYINFSAADTKFVEQSSLKIRRSKVQAIVSMVSAIIVGVGCSLIANSLS